MKIVECVPNFSEGRDLAKVEKIVSHFKNVDGVTLLDYSSDKDHNRTVVTVVGQPEQVKKAVIAAIGSAVELIDLNKHEGQHPRMGAVDVVPFIPIKDVTIEEAIEMSHEVAKAAWENFGLPMFLYEKSAQKPNRENLAVIRKGEYEGLKEKMAQEEWTADYGKNAPHPTAGATVCGARQPLVAFNVNIDTPDLEIASTVAKKVRFVGGGLRFVKAMGVDLTERNQTQISMNLTDYTKTSIYFALELIKAELKRYNVPVVGTEIIGLVPYDALYQVANYSLNCQGKSNEQVEKMTQEQILAATQDYLNVEGFSNMQVLEIKMQNC